MTSKRGSDVEFSNVVLEKIGLAVGDVSSGHDSAGEMAEALNCLRLWFAIRTEAGRRRALEGLSRIVEDEQG